MQNRRKFDFEGEPIWLAPIEYVILRKLKVFREGGSDKHLRDIAGRRSREEEIQLYKG